MTTGTPGGGTPAVVCKPPNEVVAKISSAAVSKRATRPDLQGGEDGEPDQHDDRPDAAEPRSPSSAAARAAQS